MSSPGNVLSAITFGKETCWQGENGDRGGIAAAPENTTADWSLSITPDDQVSMGTPVQRRFFNELSGHACRAYDREHPKRMERSGRGIGRRQAPYKFRTLWCRREVSWCFPPFRTPMDKQDLFSIPTFVDWRFDAVYVINRWPC